MSSDIISFFFQGTTLHRSTNHDVITSFYDVAQKHSNARLFDGVGSNPGNLSDEHPTPGRYIYDPKSGKKIRVKDETLYKVSDFMKRVNGFLAGDGIDELLFEAILYVEQAINEGKEPPAINIHGFSRGADASLRLANILDSLYPHIEVNVFLIDQVPGPGRRDDPPSYTVPANVKCFESTLMLHEYKPGFDPQDGARYVFASPSTTKSSIKVFPGDHGRGIYHSDNETANEVARLVHDDLLRFTKETGSIAKDIKNEDLPPYKFLKKDYQYEDRPSTPLTPHDRFVYYNSMMKHWWFYSKGTVLNKRAVLTDYALYSQDPALFANQEHGELFQELYPALYMFFMLNDTAVNQKELTEQLEKLANLDPFYQNFCKACKIEASQLEKDEAGNYKGLAPRLAPYPYFPPLGKPLVRDEFSYLHYAIMSVANYSIHHKKENSPRVKKATENLLKDLRIATEITDAMDAVNFLRGKMASIALYLKETDSNSYVYQQLAKLSIDPNEFIDKAIKLFGENPRPIWGLNEHQDNGIQRIKQKLEALKTDNSLNSSQKLTETKKLIAGAKFLIQPPPPAKAIEDSEDEVAIATITHNVLSESMYFFDPAEKTPLRLISELNKLDTPAGYSLASEFAKDFVAYSQRNILWNFVNTVLSSIIRLNLPPFVSPKKSELANDLAKKLNELAANGQGNDFSEISRVLNEGQTRLNKIYKNLHQSLIDNRSKTPYKTIRGSFDRLLASAQGRVRAEIIEITEFKTPTEPEKELPPSEEAFFLRHSG